MMQKPRKLTRAARQEIVDVLVAEATNKFFYGDTRDGAAPAINLVNFITETPRYGALAFRARLLRLSDTELRAESQSAAKYVELSAEKRQEYLTLAERYEAEDAERALRRRQADLGRRHRLRPAILAAARHFRARGMTAKGAWRAMKKQPFRTSDGHVAVSNKDQMRHFNGKRKRASIGLKHWQDRYWSAAGEP